MKFYPSNHWDAYASYYGDDVIFSTNTSTYCSTCGFNILIGTGYDPECPTCGGSGVVNTTATTSRKCRVFWKGFAFDALESGETVLGDCHFILPKEDETELDAVDYVEIDDIHFLVSEKQNINVPNGEIRFLRVICEKKHG